MQKWEYCMVVRVAGHSSASGPYGELVLLDRRGRRLVARGDSIERTISLLNRLGEDGWEVVGYTSTAETERSDRWMLKRPACHEEERWQS
jgi:hypothetical protein